MKATWLRGFNTCDAVAKVWTLYLPHDHDLFWETYRGLLHDLNPDYKDALDCKCYLLPMHKQTLVFESTLKALKVPTISLYQRPNQLILVRSGEFSCIFVIIGKRCSCLD